MEEVEPKGTRIKSVTEIKPGDLLQRIVVLDFHRGYVKETIAVVVQRKGYNIEIDSYGSTDWWYWPNCKHELRRIPAISRKLVTDLNFRTQTS